MDAFARQRSLPMCSSSPLFLFFAVFVSALHGCAVPVSGPWITFRHPTQPFEVDVPGELKPHPVTEVQGDLYSLERNPVAFIVQVSLLSPELKERFARGTMTSDRMFELSKSSYAQTHESSRVLAEAPITLGTYPGREFRFERPKTNMLEVQREFYTGDAIWTFAYVFRPGAEVPADRDRFFNSIRLLNP